MNLTSFSISLAIGIFSGIITSIIIYTLILIFKKIVVPWYQDLIYKGVDITGEWFRTFETDDDCIIEAHFHLKQKGHLLSGFEEWRKRDKSGNIIRTAKFTLTGDIFDRLVNLRSKNVDKSRISDLVLLLQVIKGGSEMSGQAVWYDTTTESEIISKEARLTRTDRINDKPELRKNTDNSVFGQNQNKYG